MKIFISYSRVDRAAFARPLGERLRRAYGQNSVFFDEYLHGGDDWWGEILNQIASCDIVLYLLSNESVTSPCCRAEFAEARRLQKRIITVQVRGRTRLTPELADIHYVDLSGGLAEVSVGVQVNVEVNLPTGVPTRTPTIPDRSYALALIPLTPFSRRRRGKKRFCRGFPYKLPLVAQGEGKRRQLRKSYLVCDDTSFLWVPGVTSAPPGA